MLFKHDGERDISIAGLRGMPCRFARGHSAAMSTVRILVDADACPVKDEIYRVAWRLEVPVTVVSNAHLRVPDHPLIARIVVSDGFDAADDWIAEAADARAVVVTADILLADRCLKAGATVIATVSSNEKAELARAAGAHHVVNYTDPDTAKAIGALADQIGIIQVFKLCAWLPALGLLTFLLPRGARRA